VQRDGIGVDDSSGLVNDDHEIWRVMSDLFQDGETPCRVCGVSSELSARPSGPYKCHLVIIACHIGALW
jgi:hypothetical protein